MSEAHYWWDVSIRRSIWLFLSYWMGAVIEVLIAAHHQTFTANVVSSLVCASLPVLANAAAGLLVRLEHQHKEASSS